MNQYFSRLFAFIFILLSQVGSGQILINEFLASNTSINADPDYNAFSDWIEIYNSDTKAIDISNWYLNDNHNNIPIWHFPANTTIPAKAYILIWADGMNKLFHTDFKLSADGEEIVLYDNNKNIIDEISFSTQLPNISFGRKTDGNSEFAFFTKPTPGSSNNNSKAFTKYVEQVPLFSIDGGFYTNPVNLSIHDLYNKGTIRYTLDGSDPSDSSAKYTTSLQISFTTVVKARMFYQDQIPGPIITNTYFINEHFDKRKLPVLSLSTLPANFYGKDSGIYVQTFKPEWEYPIHLEFYQADGLLGFHHDAGVSVGGLNAWILPQKLLNIYSRKKYGEGHFDFQVFQNIKRNQYGDIILRCSGNDWSNTFFRDRLMQSLIKDYADLDGQAIRPCATFINGKYLGLHNIREKQDAEYCQYYHGIDPDSLDYIENNVEIKEGNLSAYNAMLAQLNAGLKSNAAIESFETIFDTKNYTDYIISEIFSANTSWGHNVSCFRKRANAAKWRWLLHDFDRGFDLANVQSTGMTWITATNGSSGNNPPWATLFLRKLLENESFKQNFITRFADHLFVTYHPNTISKKVDFHSQLIQNEMPYQIDRWKGTTSSYGNAIPSYAYWVNEVEQLKQFGEQRNTYMWSDLNSYFNLDGTSSLKVDVSMDQHGFIKLHELKIPTYPWAGTYFINRNIRLTACAKPGFVFSHWEKINEKHNTIIAFKSNWKYRDLRSAPPANWMSTTYDDSNWSSGNGEFGYGDNDETTLLNYGTDPNNKTISYYFRNTINITDINKITEIIFNSKIDDGCVLYVNGKEVWRYNLPLYPSLIGFDTLAITAINATNENIIISNRIPMSYFTSGKNTIAIEIHQSAINSSDISFDAELITSELSSLETVSTDSIYDFSLDANSKYLKAIFNPNGLCGYLPDSIKTDLILSKACSPYIITHDVFVNSGVKLIAEPGVEVKFTENTNLYVHGALEFNGTENNTIKLIGFDDQTIWGGLFLSNTTADSKLSYVQLKHASSGIDRTYFPAAISCYHANLQMDHMEITDVKDNPIFARFSDIVLLNSKIKSSVTGDCINVKQGFGHVENCQFEGGFQADMDAIDYDGVKNGIVRNNVIHDFRGDNNDGLDIGEKCQNLIIENHYCPTKIS